MTDRSALNLNAPECQAALRLEQRYFDAYNQKSRELESELGNKTQELTELQRQLQQSTQEIELKELQLRQAQDELDLSTHYIRGLEQFQYNASHILKFQAKLLIKGLLRRGLDRLRWILPESQVRRHKEQIKALLHKL